MIPSARISVQPKISEQTVQLPVKAGLNLRSGIDLGELPASLRTIQVEGRRSWTSSGLAYLPVKPAEGTVKFTNLTNQAVEIPAGTVVSTLGAKVIRFKTTRTSTVYAGPGQIKLVPIEAVVWGTSGNQPSNQIKAIEGPLGLKLSVTNPAETLHGADAPAPAPTQEDQQRLFKQLQSQLTESAANELMRSYQAQSEQTGFPILPTLRMARILEEEYLPGAGEPGNQVQLSLRLEFEIMVLPTASIYSSVKQLMDEELPDGYLPITDSLMVEHLGDPTLDRDGNAHWVVEGRREITAQIQPNAIASRLAGKRIKDLRALVQDLPFQERVSATIFPAWWPYFPFLQLRIQVQEITLKR
jgi:hypothetical protein